MSVYFNRYFGVQIEGGYFSGSNEHKQYVPTCTGETCSQLVYTAQGGPVFRLPLGRWVPFAHMLGGGERTNGPAGQSLMWGWGATGGVGLDYVFPFWGQHLAVRPIQADYQYSQVVYGPLLLPSGTEGGFSALNNLKLSAGLVLRLGDVEPPYPVMLGCGAQPATVYPGDPIKVEANALHLNPKKTPVYTWASNGGKITASGPEATIDTSGLAPGEYTVTGHVQEGPRARQQASCAAPFTIRAFEPPTLTCSANPSTAVSGTDIAISTVGTSPQNRPLTYSYTATAGVIASSGPTAILTTAGLSPSTITVTCNVVDDLGQTAKATTDVIITAPVVPVVPQTQQLCSLAFSRDLRRPVRVDNEAKGCLDDIALTLTQQTDARLIMVGNSAPGEKPEAAAERALNAREYLVQEKGIDPSRIELRIGSPTGKTVTDTLVPAGAVFNNQDTHTFDEKTIVRHGQAYWHSALHEDSLKVPRKVFGERRPRNHNTGDASARDPRAAYYRHARGSGTHDHHHSLDHTRHFGTLRAPTCLHNRPFYLAICARKGCIVTSARTSSVQLLLESKGWSVVLQLMFPSRSPAGVHG